jgi:predicted MPP superfamily phosphohydrolase
MPWQLKMTLYSFLLAAIPYAYIGWRLYKAIMILLPEGGRPVHFIIAALILLVNLWPLTILGAYSLDQIHSLFVFRPYFTIWDYLILYPFWLGLIVIVELVPYYLSLDVLNIIINLAARDHKDNLIRLLALTKIILLAVMTVYVGYRSYRDTNTIEINRFEAQLNKKLPGLDRLSLLLIGDVQVDRYTGTEKLNLLHQRLDSCRPDILFFAGDLVTNGQEYIEQGIKALCATRAGLEKIACMGDHDLWSGPGAISQGLKNCGWKFIQNGHYTIEKQGYRILVTVITHVYSQRIGLSQMHTLLGSKPEADLNILLVHQPAEEIVKSAKENGYDIFLAGHTHGGQVVFKPFGFNLTPSQFENSHYSGFKKDGDLNIFVTNGIGLTMMPLRYRAPAEVMEITIKRH